MGKSGRLGFPRTLAPSIFLKRERLTRIKMTKYFCVKGWEGFQHYKDRNPIRKRRYLSGKIRRTIWLRFNKTCQICGCVTKLFGKTVSPFCEQKPCAIDHIVPFSKGGRCIDENFQLLCVTCNSQKGGKYAVV